MAESHVTVRTRSVQNSIQSGGGGERWSPKCAGSNIVIINIFKTEKTLSVNDGLQSVLEVIRDGMPKSMQTR